ncbi:MAG: phosphatase PAP2 family protein [Gammaproteobacteria bacterium]|nr:phosphatase PAP2 family protein [Gammaproteobacteria bacterium]
MMETGVRKICETVWQFWPTLVCWSGVVVSLVIIERISVPPCRWDSLILGVAQDMRHSQLDRFFAWITWTGSLYLLTPATAIITVHLSRAGRSGDAWLLALGLAGASLLAHGSKPLFGRGRPDLFTSLVELPADASYPSAHSAQILAFALSLFLTLRPVAIPNTALLLGILLLWAIAVGLSRVYLQVHYPSDVVGGAMLALLWVYGLEHLLHVLGMRVR